MTRDIREHVSAQGDRGKSYIRADEEGWPTPEQEVIAPPGSPFVQDGGIFGIRVGGTGIPFTDRRVSGEITTGRLTRRAEVDGERGPDGEAMTPSEVADETSRAISESWARHAESRVAFVPVGRFGGMAAGAVSHMTRWRPSGKTSTMSSAADAVSPEVAVAVQLGQSRRQMASTSTRTILIGTRTSLATGSWSASKNWSPEAGVWIPNPRYR